MTQQQYIILLKNNKDSRVMAFELLLGVQVLKRHFSSRGSQLGYRVTSKSVA